MRDMYIYGTRGAEKSIPTVCVGPPLFSTPFPDEWKRQLKEMCWTREKFEKQMRQWDVLPRKEDQ